MRFLFLFIALLFIAPLADAQKPDDDKSGGTDLFGTWEYTVNPDSPMATGIFTLEDGANQINGTFVTDGDRKMENILVSNASLTFTFTQPGMGEIAVSLEVQGDGSLAGGASLPGADEPIPVIAVRPTDDSSED